MVTRSPAHAIRAPQKIRKLKTFISDKFHVVTVVAVLTVSALAVGTLVLISMVTGRHHSPNTTTVADTEPAMREETGAPLAADPERAFHVAAAGNAARTVVAHSGDTLSKLAALYLGDADLWPKIWDINFQIVNPDVIEPGQFIKIPAAGALVTARRLPVQAPAAARSAPAMEPGGTSMLPASASAYQRCVAEHESTDDPTAQNPDSTASGEYGFLDTTWQGLGWPFDQYPSARSAPMSLQNAAFQLLYQRDGTAPWQTDGCG